MQINRGQLEAIGCEVDDGAVVDLVQFTGPAAVVLYRACPVCGAEGGLARGSLRVRSGSDMVTHHRCHIECVDWPTVPVGTRSDPSRAGRCICEECLEAQGRPMESCPELPESEWYACWCCEDIMRRAQRDALDRALERTLAQEAKLLDEAQDRLDDETPPPAPAKRARPGQVVIRGRSRQEELDLLAIEQEADKQSQRRGLAADCAEVM